MQHGLNLTIQQGMTGAADNAMRHDPAAAVDREIDLDHPFLAAPLGAARIAFVFVKPGSQFGIVAALGRWISAGRSGLAAPAGAWLYLVS